MGRVTVGHVEYCYGPVTNIAMCTGTLLVVSCYTDLVYFCCVCSSRFVKRYVTHRWLEHLPFRSGVDCSTIELMGPLLCDAVCM